MKPKYRTKLLSKPKATQRRNSLQRLKDESLLRNVRVILSPLPHFSPFKLARKSITNYSPRTSIKLVKKLRNSAKRKNEVEKLQEESFLKKCVSDGIPFGSKRALRSRLILTPKSPLVRVKRTAKPRANSRKIISTLPDNAVHREVVIELEKLPFKQKSSEKNSSKVDEPESVVNDIRRNDRSSQVQRSLVREFKIVLEKLPPKFTQFNESEKKKSVPDASSLLSKNDVSTSEHRVINNIEANAANKNSKDLRLQEVTVLLDKLPETVFTSPTKRRCMADIDVLQFVNVAEDSSQRDEYDGTSEHNREATISLSNTEFISPTKKPRVIDIDIDTDHVDEVAKNLVSDNVDNTLSENIRTADENRGEIATSSSHTVIKQMSSPITPGKVSETLSTPVSTPTSKTAQSIERSDKKTPRSLDIPLRHVTIVKSKFTKMNKALESPGIATPVKVRPTNTYLFSPSTKLKTSEICKSSTKVAESPSRLESSITDISSSPNYSSAEKTVSGKTTIARKSLQSTTAKSASSPSFGVLSPILKPRPRIDSACDLSRTTSVGSKNVGSKPVYVHKSPLTSPKWSYNEVKSQNKTKSILVKKTSKKPTAPNVEESESTAQSAPIESPPASQSGPLCTEVNSPLSRGQLLTQKSLASSPNLSKMILVKSPSQSVRLSRSDNNRDAGDKTPAKSPFNRGRLLTEHSLATSSSTLDKSGSLGKKTRRSISADSNIHRSPLKIPIDGRQKHDVSYKQKWPSAGDLLKIASVDKDGQDTASRSSSQDLSPVAMPLDPIPATEAFSNANTCAAILSTLEIADLDKPKSASTLEKLSHVSNCQVARSLYMPPKTTKESTKIPRPSSQAAISQTDNLKSFHIPKVKSSEFSQFKKPIGMPPSSLPRSGFTPSPPGKSLFARPVLDKSLYTSSSYSTSNRARQLPTKSSKNVNCKPRFAKPPHTFNSQPSVNKPEISSSQLSTIKPRYTTDPRLAVTKPSYTSNNISPAAKHFYSSNSQSSVTKPVQTSSSYSSAFKTPHTTSKVHPPVTKSSPPSTTTARISDSAISKPSTPKLLPTAAVSPYVPSFKPLPKKPPTPSSTLTVSKSNSFSKPAQDFIKPLHVNTSTSGSRLSQKSKSRPFKTAYMSSRSSNSGNFSKCLPSGPQYSPTYSKYLQNGFSFMPSAQYKLPKPSKPVSPGTNNVLCWSTIKPWSGVRQSSPPNGPSESMTTSTVTSDPSFSPLCPQFD